MNIEYYTKIAIVEKKEHKVLIECDGLRWSFSYSPK